MSHHQPFSCRDVLALAVVTDNVPGLANSLRSTCRDLRVAIPTKPERLDDLDLNPSFVRWMTDTMSDDDKKSAEMAIMNTIIRSGDMTKAKALGIPVCQDMVKEAVQTGQVDVLRWLQENYALWTDEAAVAQCIRWSKFDLIEELGLNLHSSAYIHASMTNNVEAIDWLAKKKVMAAHNLASFGAAFGNVEAMERAFELGIGGCVQVAFKTACNRKRINVLEALWRRGYFNNYVFSAAFKTGSKELLEWGQTKRSTISIESRHIVECLVHVIKRDDLELYVHLYKTSPYHCLTSPMMDGIESYGAKRIAAFLETQYGPVL